MLPPPNIAGTAYWHCQYEIHGEIAGGNILESAFHDSTCFDTTYNASGYPNVRRNDGCCGRVKCNDRGAGGGINTTEGGGDVSQPVAVVGGAVFGAEGSARHTHRVVWSSGCAQLHNLPLSGMTAVMTEVAATQGVKTNTP